MRELSITENCLSNLGLELTKFRVSTKKSIQELKQLNDIQAITLNKEEFQFLDAQLNSIMDNIQELKQIIKQE